MLARLGDLFYLCCAVAHCGSQLKTTTHGKPRLRFFYTSRKYTP
jgi:hypothetical protein